MGETLKQSGSFYQEEDTVKGIYINVFFHEDHQKYEIELGREKGDEGEQPLSIIISNNPEEGKNPELAKIFFELARELAEQGKSIGEIFEALEKKRDATEEINIVIVDGKKEVEKVVDGKKEEKSHWLEIKFLGENPSDEDILNYLYKLFYGAETDKRYEGGKITQEEKLVINFVRRYPQADGEILRLVYDIGEKWGITSIGLPDYLGRKKASFFLFMLHFTDLKASSIDDIDGDSNLKEILEKYFTNNTLINNSDGESTGNPSDYQWKLNILRYYGIGDEGPEKVKNFNEIIEEKYNEFIEKVLILNRPKERLAELILQKLGKKNIPQNSPIFGVIVQLLQGKKFENISMGGFDELEDGVLERVMEEAGIPTTREGLEKFLINEDKHEKEE